MKGRYVHGSGGEAMRRGIYVDKYTCSTVLLPALARWCTPSRDQGRAVLVDVGRIDGPRHIQLVDISGSLADAHIAAWGHGKGAGKRGEVPTSCRVGIKAQRASIQG